MKLASFVHLRAFINEISTYQPLFSDHRYSKKKNGKNTYKVATLNRWSEHLQEEWYREPLPVVHSHKFAQFPPIVFPERITCQENLNAFDSDGRTHFFFQGKHVNFSYPVVAPIYTNPGHGGLGTEKIFNLLCFLLVQAIHGLNE